MPAINYNNLMLKVSELEVLLAIYDANGYALKYVPYSDIAERCNLSRATVSYNVEKLQRAGIVKITMQGLQIIRDDIISADEEAKKPI